MIVVIRSIMASLAALALVGCGPSLAGRYVGKRPVKPGPDHIVGTLEKVELDLKSDGRFSLLNLSLSSDGYWRVEDGKVILDTTHVLGNPARDRSSPHAVIDKSGLIFFDPELDADGIPLRKVDR